MITSLPQIEHRFAASLIREFNEFLYLNLMFTFTQYETGYKAYESFHITSKHTLNIKMN